VIINRATVQQMWETAVIRPECTEHVMATARQLVSFKAANYVQVEAATGIPWYVVGAFDYREEDFDHTCYLGNGDPLSSPTVSVPAGRGPFATWYEGAIDSLTMDSFNILPAGFGWDIVTCLDKCVEWNGMGYSEMGIPSPYDWAGTNHQVAGKYVSDGVFDPTVWDVQVGCAALFLAMKTLDSRI
jgi:lysozyme family protein